MPRRRVGNSLSEQLIALAIVGSLAGFAMPFFQGYLRDTRAARVRQDLEQFVQGIHRFKQTNRRTLAGGSLSPLLQGTLGSIPRDPWGNPYFFDGNLGVVGSYGADGEEFGEQDGADTFVQYQRHIQILDAVLVKGGFGLLQKNDRLDIRLSKPVEIVEAAEVASDFDLHSLHPGALPVDLDFLGFEYQEALSRPAEGYLVFRVPEEPASGQKVFLGQGSRVTSAGFVSSMREMPAPFEESGIRDPSRFLWGFEPAVRSDGSWGGAEIRRN